MDQYLDMLGRIPLFSGLSKGELREVAQVTTELRVKAGTELIRQGSTASEAFVIVNGEADVTRDGEHLATVGAGQIQGELSLLLDRPRTAAVTAKSDMTILDIDRRSFNLLLDDIPMIARKMLPIVAERLASNAEHQHDT